METDNPTKKLMLDDMPLFLKVAAAIVFVLGAIVLIAYTGILGTSEGAEFIEITEAFRPHQNLPSGAAH